MSIALCRSMNFGHGMFVIPSGYNRDPQFSARIESAEFSWNKDMERRLTPEQLKLVVAEVQELDQLRQQELDAKQVQEVLQELGMPPELLEDAVIQLHRRQALAAQQRRRRWLWGGGIAMVAAIFVGYTLIGQNQQQQLSKVVAQADRVTLTQDDGSSRQEIDRQGNNQVFYRVTLADATVGQSLSLSCNWIDPSGQVAHQNRYQTKTITTPVWQTVCRNSIGPTTTLGTWQVQAFVGDRQISSAKFTIR